MIILIYVVILLEVFISLYGFELLFSSVLLFQPKGLHLPFILVDVLYTQIPLIMFLEILNCFFTLKKIICQI